MSFLIDFEDDIFISFAHSDNQAPLSQRGWVDTFHHALEERLERYLGSSVKTWRVPRLQGNDYSSDEPVGRLSKAAIMIAVLSPSYVNSEWCLREMQSFIQVADETGGIRLGTGTRVFMVEKVPSRGTSFLPS